MSENNMEFSQKIDAAAGILASASYAIALTGAGMSVESGIPPFRGPGGLWTKYGEPPMDGYQRFLKNPHDHWKELIDPPPYRRELNETLERAMPNPGHYAFAELESMGVLKFLITQNVDNLHIAAGSSNIAEIHGNYRLVRCTGCVSRFPRKEISLDEIPPLCPRCGHVLKGDTVMFGEPIPVAVLERCMEEVGRSDCMILAGTSATVQPAASFPEMILLRGGSVIELNLYDSPITSSCTVILRGQTGTILSLLVKRLKQWKGETRNH